MSRYGQKYNADYQISVTRSKQDYLGTVKGSIARLPGYCERKKQDYLVTVTGSRRITW